MKIHQIFDKSRKSHDFWSHSLLFSPRKVGARVPGEEHRPCVLIDGGCEAQGERRRSQDEHSDAWIRPIRCNKQCLTPKFYYTNTEMSRKIYEN